VVEIVLSSLGMGTGRTSVFRAVQAIARQLSGMGSEKVLGGCKTKAVGTHLNF